MKYLKAMLSDGLGRVARTGLLDRFEAPLLGMTNRLLDPAAIPTAARPRPIRGGRQEALCNPYVLFHRSMYWFGRLHERGLDDLLRGCLGPCDTLIDVGANFGHVTMLGASLVGDGGRVHAFEPHPGLSSQLADHARDQGCAGVTVHRLGLGSRDGEFTLNVNPNHLGASTIREIEGESGHAFTVKHQVQVRRGDDVLRGEDLPGRVFLKIDVEGNEPAVIEGMAETIRDRVSVMAIEATPEWHGGPEGIAALIARVADLGFRPYLFDDEPDAGPLLKPLDDRGSIAAQTNIAFVREAIGDGLSRLRRPVTARVG